jgi:hypothetical protein
MGKKSPDVKGAAKKEAAASKEIALQSNYADRPDQHNAWGDMTWEQKKVRDPATGELVTKWTQNQSLSPQMQQLFDQENAGMMQRGGMNEVLMRRSQDEMGDAPDWAQFGQAEGMQFSPDQMRAKAENDAYQRDVMRLDPQFAQEQAQTEAKLRNQGLVPGDAAYDSAMSNFSQGKNDAYERARYGAAAAGRDEVTGMWNREVQGNEMSNALRDSNIAEYIAKRGFSLGEAGNVGGAQEFSKAIKSAPSGA